MPMTAADPKLDLVSLMREHQAGVWRYLRALGADAAASDDLTQEVFLAVYRKPFEQRSRPETVAYLRTTARNLFLKSRRNAGKLVTVEELEAIDRQYTELAGDEDGAALAATLKECLKELEDRPRQAIDMQYQKGMQRLEIATQLGMTDDGVKTLLARTKARLKKCMELRLKH